MLKLNFILKNTWDCPILFDQIAYSALKRIFVLRKIYS